MVEDGVAPKVPQAKITSLDITSARGGLDQRGEANISPDAFSVGRNIMVNSQGLATYRLVKKRFLPDVVEDAGQAYPVLWGGIIRYFTADDGKIKHTTDVLTYWNDCTGENVIETGPDVTVTFLRILDKVFIMNGEDKLGYVDLNTVTFSVVHYELVADPTLAPTGTNVVLTGTPYFIYYAISYNGVIGKTKTSPILKHGVSKIRDQWKADGTEGVKVIDPNAIPVGATSRNIYFAAAPAGSTIQISDMLPLALGLDINVNEWFDNGQTAVRIDAGLAPEKNSTDGPRAKYGIEIEGRPFFFGIKDDEYAVLIGGDGEHADDLSENNGGYRLVLNQGTNFYPKSVVGFRNGQGIPSITVLFSNTEGLSKQSIIEQQTVSLGTFSGTVWGQTDQNYGAAGVSSPYAVTNYRGALIMPTTDGIIKIDTQASLQNVLLPQRISDPIIDEIESIQTNLLEKIVGAAWANRIMLTVPARGFNYNNLILVYDNTRKDNECWYTFDIRAQWIGVISPPNDSGFVYIAQDNHFYRFEEGYIARDETVDGLTESFPVEYTSALIGNNAAHTGYYAVVQGLFYLADFVGSATIKVTWRDYQSGRMKSRQRVVTNGDYAKSSLGNWSSPGYQYNVNTPTDVLTWSDVDEVADNQNAAKTSRRFRIPLNNIITNELQATVIFGDSTALVIRSVSFEGQALGISPDIR